MTSSASPPPPPSLQSGGSQKRLRAFRSHMRVLANVARRSYLIARKGFPLAWPTPRRAAATWRWARRVVVQVRRRRRENGLTVAVDISPLFDVLTGVGWYLYELLRQLADRPDLHLRLYGPTMFTRTDGPQPVKTPPEGRAIEWVRHEIPDDLLVRRSWLALLMRILEPWAGRGRPEPRRVRPQLRPAAAVRRLETAACGDGPGPDPVPDALDDAGRDSRRSRTEARTDGRPCAGHRHTVGNRPDASSGTRRRGSRRSTCHLGRRVGSMGWPPARCRPACPSASFCTSARSSRARTWRPCWPRGPASAPQCRRRRRSCCAESSAGSTSSIEGALARAIAEGWLLCLGYAPDETLRALYDRAAVVVCPSVYEGFGLPLVEAMAAGTPIVCSDIPVFREVAADAALFVPADDAPGWAQAVAQVLSDPDRARDLEARGSARVRAFSWRRTAERTLAVWSDAAKSA